jgi:hypothetical protein
MAQHSVTSEYFSGQGIVMISNKHSTTGEPTGFIPVGNVTELTLSTEISKNEHKESMTGQRAVDLTLSTETKVNFSAVFESLSQENLAYALRGAVSDVTAGTATGETVVAALGKIVPLSKIGIADFELSSGSTTYVVNENYKVDTSAGSVYFMTAAEQSAASAANIVTDAASLTADYTYSAQTVMDAMTLGVQTRWVRFEGLNTVDSNSPVIVDVFKMDADLLNELSLISDELNNFTLTGSVLTDDTRQTGSKHFRVKKLK